MTLIHTAGTKHWSAALATVIIAFENIGRVKRQMRAEGVSNIRAKEQQSSSTQPGRWPWPIFLLWPWLRPSEVHLQVRESRQVAIHWPLITSVFGYPRGLLLRLNSERRQLLILMRRTAYPSTSTHTSGKHYHLPFNMSLARQGLLYTLLDC